MNDAADKWKELGVQLLRSDQEIAVDHPGDAVSCCKRVLEKWLDTTTDATWNQLITALRSPSVQLNNLASQLEQKLSKECKIYGNGWYNRLEATGMYLVLHIYSHINMMYFAQADTCVD